MTVKYKKIAILGDVFVGWGGGIEFLRYCLQALILYKNDRNLQLYLLLPDPENSDLETKIRRILSPYKRMAKDILNLKVPRYYSRAQPFSRNQLIDAFGSLSKESELIFYDGKKSLATAIKSSGIEVVIPCLVPLDSSIAVPWVGYIFDFQHKYYPIFFSKSEQSYRDRLFARTLDEAEAVIVNAKSVEDDIRHFYPEANCNVFSLPFAASPMAGWFDPPEADLAEKYRLPSHYFIISNQFWKHKSHETAFKALAHFSERTGREDVHIVCTGKTEDFRHPEFFHMLCSTVDDLKLNNRIHFLGHIPKKDQIDIMKGSIAVLQPTLFEGGPAGGAVYDAVSMGVPAILSDIPINREIEEEQNLFYFKAGDAEDLAQKMVEVMSRFFFRPTNIELIAAGERRIFAFGQRLLEAIEYVVCCDRRVSRG